MNRIARFGLCLLLVSNAAAQSRLNLPNRNKTAPLGGDAAAVSQYLSSAAARPGQPLPRDAEQAMLASLPPEHHSGCLGMVRSWGEEAQGSARLRLYLLHHGSGSAWFALRCASGFEGLERFYDERLIFLRGSTLQLLPFGPDVTNDSTLYHVQFSEDLPLQDADATLFRVSTDSDNPCCGGGDNSQEERLIFYVVRPEGAKQVFSALMYRYVYSHDDEQGDAEITRRVKLSYERNPGGQVLAAIIRFHEETKEEGNKAKPAVRSGEARYRWNPVALRFDLQPPAR